MTRLEVRCCCNAGQLLGTLPVLEKDVKNGAEIPFLVMQPRTDFITRATRIGSPAHARLTVAPFGAVRSPTGSLFEAERTSYLALKSNHHPIEVLRRIPGFIEAKERING